MVSIRARFLNGQAVEREALRAQPVDSERIAAIIGRVRRRKD